MRGVNQPIITAQLHLSTALREPNDEEVAAAGKLLERLDGEARALGETPQAAPVHHAIGRLWIERLGDPRAAASAFQAAFILDPKYRPTLEAARRLFAAENQWERVLALHQKEEALLGDAAAKAESLLAQARILSRELKAPEKAEGVIDRALELSPEHPALLREAVQVSERAGDRLVTAKLLLRSAQANKDDVQRGLMLRRAALILEELHAQSLLIETTPSGPTSVAQFPLGGPAATMKPAELEALHEESLRRLLGASPGDPIATLVMAQRARAKASWDELVQLAHEEAERSSAPSEFLLAAQIAAYKQSRALEGLGELRAGLKVAAGDPMLHALAVELAGSAASELPAALAAAIAAATSPGEKAELQVLAALCATTPLERETLLSNALAENPGDAAAIALHARTVAERDAHAAAERYVALAEALESHAPAEAADHYAEAGLWLERSGTKDTAVALAKRALALQPGHAPSQRLLARELPFLGEHAELAQLLEQLGGELEQKGQPGLAAEQLMRAAMLTAELPEPEPQENGGDADEAISPAHKALELALRAARLAEGQSAPRGSEAWTLLALRAGNFESLVKSLEVRAGLANPAEAAELLVEAGELLRVLGDDAGALAMLQRARATEPGSNSARAALLHLPALPIGERIDALLDEANRSEPSRAAGLHAERAALLESAGRFPEAIAACQAALAAGGSDLSLLRRLARLQSRAGDLPAAIAALEQLAQELPEAADKARMLSRAAGIAEWRMGDPAKADELHGKALALEHDAVHALAARARLLHWSGKAAEAAAAFEALAGATPVRGQKLASLRTAASLRAYRTREPGRAAELLRSILKEEPGDLAAMAGLLALGGLANSLESRRERAELRARLASRCQDPRMAAVLRADSAEDRFASGERDQGVAELRRALALNPNDRISLDRVEDALRASQSRQLLIDHLSFRCACEEGPARAALALEQAELFVEESRLDQAAAAYKLALQSDPSSLFAVRGARRLAEQMGDKPELMKLYAKEAGLTRDGKQIAALSLEAARLAQELGESDDAITHLTRALEKDPQNAQAPAMLRALHGEDGAKELAELFERIGGDDDAQVSAFAWVQAGRIQLAELKNSQQAFVFAGRALARLPELREALLLRADAGEAIARYGEVTEALLKLLALAPQKPGEASPQKAELELRLGRLYLHAMGEAKKALPLLIGHLAALEVPTLLALAPHANLLEAKQQIPLYSRLLEIFAAPAESGSPTRQELANWIDALAKANVADGNLAAALVARRRGAKIEQQLEPESTTALRALAELAAKVPEAAAEAAEAWERLFALAPKADALHALFPLFKQLGRADAAFVCAALLVALKDATPEEAAHHEQIARLPPAAELPSLAEVNLRAPDDSGPARALLAAAAGELAKAFPTAVTGRAERVKGDNPVRRVCAALARALGIPEPALYLSKSEPSVVAPAAVEPVGLIVGAEAPRKYPPRVQRFLYSRALAQVKHGTHPLVDPTAQTQSITRLGPICAELIRLCSPEGAELSGLPPRDESIESTLSAALSTEARARLAPLCPDAIPALASLDRLALGIRESAERLAMILCGDPAAALGVITGECPGGLARPEVARLAKFALSPEHLAHRAK